MRKENRILIFLVLSFVLVLPFFSAGAQELQIITEEWPPYNFEKDGKVSGFSTEIVQEIMSELNETHEIKLLPGARGDQLMESGKMVMNFSLFRTPAREKRFKFIGPIAEDAVYFYKKKGRQLSINTLDDAKKVNKVASPHKGLVYTHLVKAGFTNLDKTTKAISRIKKLLMGRTDLSVGITTLGVAYELKQLGEPMDAVTRTPVKLVEFPLYIVCTKNVSDNVIKRWQDALNRIKATGKYQTIYQRYMN